MLPCWLVSVAFSRGVTASSSERAIITPSASSRTWPMPYQVLTKARSSATRIKAATPTATRTSIITKPRLVSGLATARRHNIDETGEPIDTDAPVQVVFDKVNDGAAGAAIGRETDREAAARVDAQLARDNVEGDVRRQVDGHVRRAAGDPAVGDIHPRCNL